MPLLALFIFALYVLIAFAIRTVVQLRRTGDTGFRGFSGTPGSAEWWASILFIAALIVTILGLVGALLGVPAVPPLDHDWIHILGLVLAAGGILGTFLTQLAMGENWRVGVDPTEHTALVTSGPFGLVRNPIFTAMLIACAGIALAVPNPLAILGWLLLLTAIEFQVRAVEEPHLRRQHGETYRRYSARVGRFLPGLGTF